MKKKIFVIDEELVLIEPVLDILAWDYPDVEYKHFRTGYAGLNALFSNGCDIVILDMMLPLGDPNGDDDKADLLNGIIILEKIREKEKFKNLPVVCFTVVDDKQTIQSINNLEAKYVCKIYEKSCDMLFSTITSILNNK